jgi:hypothetical protein
MNDRAKSCVEKSNKYEKSMRRKIFYPQSGGLSDQSKNQSLLAILRLPHMQRVEGLTRNEREEGSGLSHSSFRKTVL